MPVAPAPRHPAPNHAIPNHHANHPAFRGLRGLVIGLTFAIGRDDVGELAAGLTDVGPGARVLDIGCGPGPAVRVAIRRGATATGVDPAAVMLRLARLFTRSRGASWRAGTAESLPLADASVDVAWSLSTVHHWNDIDLGLAEVRRVLVPGGRFLVSERQTGPDATDHRSHGWTTDQAQAFAARCAAAGFAGVGVTTHTPGGVRTLVAQATKPSAA